MHNAASSRGFPCSPLPAPCSERQPLVEPLWNNGYVLVEISECLGLHYAALSRIVWKATA